MEPALDVIGRALQGDSGACSFLDRTSSIYVLDATDPSKPKTYGCWNFIHQAMNEVERYEANYARSNQIHALQNGAGLNSHVKLLSTMALRVARRSPDVDRSLVSTCVVNAGAQFNGTPEQSQWLIDLNLELREIVMGRIAAMAFDFSFHRRDGPHGHSAFADPTVMELFCAVLASNAVSSGPLAVQHFVTEWIVPSAKTLPPFAIACVTLHLALGALRTAAPAGTKDILQQLSASVVAAVLAPVLLDAVAEDSSTDSEAKSRHEKNNQIAATCIRALERWCRATDLSLAQVKHICSKVEVNFIEVVNDAMYSDSKEVVDALAELIEACVSEDEDSPMVLEERMSQVRYLLQVDEASFQSNFSAEQLNLIESKEMSAIVDDLVSAIGLQRFRFTERQNNGDHDVCRSLVRIASALCSAAMKFSADHGHPLKNEPGLIDLMMKGAAHPSVNISGIALGVLADVARLDVTLGLQLLPLLQRRAITPHHIISGEPYLAASDICGVNFHEFQIFRDTILKDALLASYEGNSMNYMDSCTSAVEEFCSENASSQVSLHLEAALFCLASVADLALRATENGAFRHASQLERCTSALAAKPSSMMTNPLTLSQMCQFLRKYTRWYGESQVQGVLDVATDLALSTFNLCAASHPGGEASRLMMQESSISPGKEAALTLREILCHHPKYFVSNSAITALGAGWEASYGACNRTDAITIEDRQTLCIAICHVLAALPENQRVRSFHALALPALDCLEKMTAIANNSIAADKAQDEIDSILSRVADEIQIFTTMARTFTNACIANDSSMESGCSTVSLRRVAIPAPLLAIIRKAWPAIVHVAAMYSNNENVATALGKFLVEFLPPECKNKASFSLLKELSSIALSILKKKGTRSQAKFQPVVAFLTEFVSVYGEAAESGVAEAKIGQTPEGKGEVTAVLTELLLATVDELQAEGPASATQTNEQGQGQPPFESKSLPAPKGIGFTGDAFCGMLSLFKACLERCPSYFFRLPSAPGLEGQEDLLYRKASDAAMGALNATDVETAKHAMDFLDTLVKLAHSQNEGVRQVALDATLRLQANMISLLLLGSCGKLSYTSLSGAAQLTRSVITAMPPTEELRSSAINALKDEQFRLGDDARHVVLSALEGVVRNEVTVEGLARLLEQIWELHQLDEVESLEASDVVMRFVKQFTP